MKSCLSFLRILLQKGNAVRWFVSALEKMVFMVAREVLEGR